MKLVLWLKQNRQLSLKTKSRICSLLKKKSRIYILIKCMSYFFIFLKLYAKNSFTCPNIMSINFVLASTLAHAICGVIKSFPLSLIFLRGLSTLIGSFVNTSRPAAEISPVSNASYKSCSTTIGPLPRFRNIAFFFIFCKCFPVHQPFCILVKRSMYRHNIRCG